MSVLLGRPVQIQTDLTSSGRALSTRPCQLVMLLHWTSSCLKWTSAVSIWTQPASPFGPSLLLHWTSFVQPASPWDSVCLSYWTNWSNPTGPMGPVIGLSLPQSVDSACLSIGPVEAQPASHLDSAAMLCLPLSWTQQLCYACLSVGLSLPLYLTSCSACPYIGPLAAQPTFPLDPPCLSFWTQPASPLDSALCHACPSVRPVAEHASPFGPSLPLH